MNRLDFWQEAVIASLRSRKTRFEAVADADHVLALYDERIARRKLTGLDQEPSPLTLRRVTTDDVENESV